MIPQLASALASGYSTKQVIQYLMRQFPQHSSKIKEAMKAGYTVDQIVKFLGGGRKEVNREEQGLTEHEKTRSTDLKRRENVNEQALNLGKMAAMAGGSALAAPMIKSALQTAAPMAQSALQRAAPQLFGPGAVTNTPGVSQTQLPPNQSQTSPAMSNQQIPSQTPLTPTISHQESQIQPEVKSINVSEIINKHGLAKHIDELSKNVKDPKAIAAILYNKFPKEMKKFQEEAKKPMEEAIADYMQSNVKPLEITQTEETIKTPTNEEAQEEPTSLESQGQELDVSQKAPKIETGHTVASPQGMGEVKAIRNGKAIIEVDGKKHQVDEEDLIESPLPEKELADLYDDLISGIEKTTGKAVSRNVDWAGYDPNTNELAYKPHGSDKIYAYEDISQEDIETLTNFLTQRKTTGSNFIGAWEKGTESPIGAAMYQLIKKLQSERGGKGSEYRNKFETIYDALEPAKKAAKERHAERKKKAKKPGLD